MMPKNPTPLSELEIYELMCAAHPEFEAQLLKSGGGSEDYVWDGMFKLYEDLSQDPEKLADFLGRIVYLTHPMQNPFSGNHAHVLGKVEATGFGHFRMTAAVSRRIGDAE